MSEPAAGKIVTRVNGAVARVIVDNPTRHNAITPEMARELCTTLSALDANPDVRVVVVAGEGSKAFVSGADIETLERAGHPDAVDGGALLDMFPVLRNFRKPTVALIRGFCFGAGVALALACDLRLAAADATFSIPSARLGIAYPADFTRWLVEVVGVAKAKEFLLTGRRYDANEAAAIDLVHKVIPIGDFDVYADEYFRNLSLNAPLSMQAAKAIVNEVANGIGTADLIRCTHLVRTCAQSADHAEGRLAFREKRAAIFTGR